MYQSNRFIFFGIGALDSDTNCRWMAYHNKLFCFISSSIAVSAERFI